MGVVASSAYQEGLALKANSADVISNSNPQGLNDILADALSLSGVPVGSSGQTPGTQTVTGPMNFSAAIALNGAVLQHVSVLAAAGPYTVSATDRYVIVNQTVGAAMTINLPAAPVAGRLVTVKDAKGDAATNNITVKGGVNIDAVVGATGVVINTAYGCIDFIFNGSTWSIL